MGARRGWPPTLERGSGQREAAVIHSQALLSQPASLPPVRAATQQRGTDHRSQPDVPTLPKPLPAPLTDPRPEPDQPLEPRNSLRSLALARGAWSQQGRVHAPFQASAAVEIWGLLEWARTLEGLLKKRGRCLLSCEGTRQGIRDLWS